MVFSVRIVFISLIATLSFGCIDKAEAEGPKDQVLATEIGEATYYARYFQGEETASGLKLDNRTAIAAHRSYPFGTVARVTNLENGRAVRVVIVDRGPYGKNRREGAIIDLSRSAASQLGMLRDGQVKVRIDVLLWGDGNRLANLNANRPQAVAK
jgi:rare lipoprotein A